MDKNKKILNVDIDPQSVQTHIGIIQSLIERMSANSTACKTWCITLVSAILVIVADKQKADYAYIAFMPTIFFAALDTHYLALEKGFINSYNTFIKKLHTNKLAIEDLYSVSIVGNSSKLQLQSIKSFSVWGFYTPMLIFILIIKMGMIKL